MTDAPPTRACRAGHTGEWARYWEKGNRKGRWICLACRRLSQRSVDERRRQRADTPATA
jgi:hypothetical protein